jgi:hypothetical protein
LEDAMISEHLPSAILATAIWAIFAVAIVFSSPPEPGEGASRAAHAGEGVKALAAAETRQADRGR